MRGMRFQRLTVGSILFLLTSCLGCSSGGGDVKDPFGQSPREELIARARRDLKTVEEMIGGIPPRITSETDQDRAISKLAEVIQAFSDLARLYPGEVEVWVGLGSAYGIGYFFELPQAREAAEATLHWAADIDPDDPRPHHTLGCFFLNTNRITQAIAELERALELDTEEQHRGVYLDLSMAYWYAGRGDESRAAVAKYMEHSPGDPRAAELMEVYGGGATE